MRSTARLAYGAARRVSIPAVSALPPVIASERWVPVDAVEQAPMRLAEERPCRGVGTDPGRGRLVDLDERAAGRGQLAEDRVEGPACARTWPAAGCVARRCTARCTACLTERSVSAGGRPPGVERLPLPEVAAIADRVEPGRSWARTAASTSSSVRRRRGEVDGAVPRGASRTRIRLLELNASGADFTGTAAGTAAAILAHRSRPNRVVG